MLRYNAHQATGTFNTLVAGSSVNGSTLFIGGNFQKVASLSAVCNVLAETSTLTISAGWQVSNDGTTWITAASAPQNPASVVIATGTGGADTAVVIAIPAPPSVYGFKFARCRLTNGIVTGAAADTYTVGYSYRQLTGAEAH